MNEYMIERDLMLIKEISGLTAKELADRFKVSEMTINRWLNDVTSIEPVNVSNIYESAFCDGIRLNRIKAQMYKDEYEKGSTRVLFHGSKEGLSGSIQIDRTREQNDFGKGFYCGESLAQSAMFVSGFPNSSIYIASFDTSGLKKKSFEVERAWMLAVAIYRGKLDEYMENEEIRRIIDDVEAADYIVAPIADNRMFEIIDSFIEGEITDIQCQHCLSATDLGKQFVLRTEKAIGRLNILEHCYLAETEKKRYIEERLQDQSAGRQKVKMARREYRGCGLYIDELL